MEDLSHDENIYMVRLAEQTERYEDMQFYMQRQINEKQTTNQLLLRTQLLKTKTHSQMPQVSAPL